MSFSIVVPVYNSESTIRPLVDRLIDSYSSFDFEIILVNDGSRDQSAKVIREIHEKYPNKVNCVWLAKNFGEHQAVMAGLSLVSKDYAIIIDDDFQNPPSEIIKLYNKAVDGGFEVVYSYYAKKKHSTFRNFGSWFNGFVANVLIDKPKNLYLSSFKCLSRFVCQEVTKYHGPYPYIDGLIFRVTTNISSVEVAHNKREVGKSNYTIGKLISLWANMAFNFSALPLRAVTMLGFVFSVIGAIFSILFIIEKILRPSTTVGWASLIVTILTFSGVQLVVLGLIGEYIGRIFLSGNLTPQYVIREMARTKSIKSSEQANDEHVMGVN